MGNTLGGKKTAKIMKINGETMKFKTPIKASEVVKDYPGHVVLDSEAVKHYGIRAKPLEPFQNLEPKRLYFLVELPKFPTGNDQQSRVPRRVRSGIHLSAKDRLESLMLSKRSVSDLSIMGPATRVMVDGSHDGSDQSGSGFRVRMRLPKSEVEQLMKESRDPEKIAERIMELCKGKTGQEEDPNGKGKEIVGVDNDENNNGSNVKFLDGSLMHNGTRGRQAGYKKKVGFMSVHEAEIGLAVAS